MSKYLGQLVDVGFAKEASRGTLESSATFFIPKMSLSIDDLIEQAIDESSIGVIEDSIDAKTTSKFSEAEIEAKVGDKSLGLLLLSLFGSVSTSGPTDSAYTHTFGVQQSAQHQSLTMFLEDPNGDYRHANMVVGSLEINAELDSFIKYKAQLTGKAGVSSTVTPSYTTENSFLSQHAVVKIASNQAGLGAASALSVRALRLTLNANTEREHNLGSTAPTDVLNKQFSVDGEITVVFNDETFKTDMLADTAKAMRIEFVNTDVTIGSSTNPTLRFDLYKYKVTDFKRNYSNGEITTATISFKAFYLESSSKMIDGVLINTQASY